MLLLLLAKQLTLNDLERMVTLQQCLRSLDLLQCIETMFKDCSSLLLLENERWSLVNTSWTLIELSVRFSPHPACPAMIARHPVRACANSESKQCRPDAFFHSLPKDCCSNSVEGSVSMVVASVSQETVHVRHLNQCSLAGVHPAVDENPSRQKQRK